MRSPQVSLICDFLLKFAGILTAVAIAIATLGIPLPIPIVKDSSTPFPCINCGCGCVNAEACWRQCCCFSQSEKLAWANRNGIKVPDFVLDQVAIEVNADPADLAKIRPCCRQRVLAEQTRSCSERNSNAYEQDEPESPVVPGVLALHALKCRGSSLSLSMLPPTVCADDFSTELVLCPGEHVLFTLSNFYQPPCFDAVVPPPEFAVL